MDSAAHPTVVRVDIVTKHDYIEKQAKCVIIMCVGIRY